MSLPPEVQVALDAAEASGCDVARFEPDADEHQGWLFALALGIPRDAAVRLLLAARFGLRWDDLGRPWWCWGPRRDDAEFLENVVLARLAWYPPPQALAAALAHRLGGVTTSHVTRRTRTLHVALARALTPARAVLERAGFAVRYEAATDTTVATYLHEDSPR